MTIEDEDDGGSLVERDSGYRLVAEPPSKLDGVSLHRPASPTAPTRAPGKKRVGR